jgi:dTDP-4-dehydrorhamnose 3,5-epimerase
MEIRPLPIPGCFELIPPQFKDQRGRFVKPFHSHTLREVGLEVEIHELCYSDSVRGVVRGLHFQAPPADHAKLVSCVRGAVLDAGVDLRRGSPTYGKHVTLELSADKGNAIYLPRGLAHGFCVLSDQATVFYGVTSLYSPEHDLNIHWNSAGIPWPTISPIVSERDAKAPRLDDFESPFVFEPALLRRAS